MDTRKTKNAGNGKTKVREDLLEQNPEQSEGVSHEMSAGGGAAGAKALRPVCGWPLEEVA